MFTNNDATYKNLTHFNCQNDVTHVPGRPQIFLQGQNLARRQRGILTYLTKNNEKYTFFSQKVWNFLDGGGGARALSCPSLRKPMRMNKWMITETLMCARSRLFRPPDTTASWTRMGLMATAAAAPRRAKAAKGAMRAARGLMPPSPPPPPPPCPP